MSWYLGLIYWKIVCDKSYDMCDIAFWVLKSGTNHIESPNPNSLGVCDTEKSQ